MSDVHLRPRAVEQSYLPGYVHGAFLGRCQPCGLDYGFHPFSRCAGDGTRSLKHTSQVPCLKTAPPDHGLHLCCSMGPAAVFL